MSSGMMMNDRPGDNGGPIGASAVSIVSAWKKE